MEGLPTPKPLNFHQEISLQHGRYGRTTNFDIQAMESDAKSDKVQTSNQMTFMGAKGREIYSTFTFNSLEDKINIQTLFNKFNAYSQQRKNLTITRHKNQLY